MLEIFISFLVLVAVLTMAISTVGRWCQPLGYDWRDIWTVRIDFGHSIDKYDATDGVLVERVMRELKAFPQIESVAASSDELMAKFFDDGTLTDEELITGLRIAVANREVFPVMGFSSSRIDRPHGA